MIVKFCKFCLVGGIGTIITFSLTWLFTEKLGLWYMASMVIAVIVATISNFTLNTMWTYKLGGKPSDEDYEWNAFYKGNLIQKWWKRSIAKTVWGWTNWDVKTLDVGCGSSPIITKYNSLSMGIDLNEDKLKFMRTKCENIRFSSIFLEDVNESFSQIICLEVVEHLSCPTIMIAEIARLVPYKGKVIIATPDYSRILWNIAEKFTPYKDEHITKFNRESLERMCKPYGLKPVKYRYIAGCDLVEMFEKVRDELI